MERSRADLIRVLEQEFAGQADRDAWDELVCVQVSDPQLKTGSEGLSGGCPGEVAKHQAAHGAVDCRLRHSRQSLILFRQPYLAFRNSF
jgi:hypothetical protein